MVTFLLTCIIPGTPQQQGSKRNVGGNRFIEANRNLAPWRADAIAYLQAEWRGRGPITEPVSLDVAFDFARPASHYGTGRQSHRPRSGQAVPRPRGRTMGYEDRKKSA